jgi:hypothetical protein
MLLLSSILVNLTTFANITSTGLHSIVLCITTFIAQSSLIVILFSCTTYRARQLCGDPLRSRTSSSYKKCCSSSTRTENFLYFLLRKLTRCVVCLFNGLLSFLVLIGGTAIYSCILYYILYNNIILECHYLYI